MIFHAVTRFGPLVGAACEGASMDDLVSGYGREMGFAAMDEYTTRKSVWINVDATLPDWYAG